MFKKFDVVRKKDGTKFSNGWDTLTVEISIGGLTWFIENEMCLITDKLELFEVDHKEEIKMLECKVKTGTITTEKVGNWEHNIINDRPDSDHYTDSTIDVWQFADANFDYDELFGFHRINVIKYVTRFGKKNGRNIRDLEKAKAVIEEMIRMEVDGE